MGYKNRNLQQDCLRCAQRAQLRIPLVVAPLRVLCVLDAIFDICLPQAPGAPKVPAGNEWGQILKIPCYDLGVGAWSVYVARGWR